LLILSCLAATWLVWGSTYLVIRFALVGFAPYFLMATRFLCAGAVLMAWQLARGATMPSTIEWRNALLVGTLMLGGGMGGVAYAEQTIASGLVVAFIAVIPLLLVVINVCFGVHPRRLELLAVTVGLVGVLMLTQGSGIKGSPAGLLAITFGTMGWALGSVLSQRGFRLAPGATGFASEMLCGGLALLVMSALRHESWHLPQEPRPVVVLDFSRGLWQPDRVQRLHAAAGSNVGESRRQLLVGESGGRALSRRDAGGRNGIGVGMARLGCGRDGRRAALERTA
jgi:drug/metabolite transporter (DMT)-like permease